MIKIIFILLFFFINFSFAEQRLNNYEKQRNECLSNIAIYLKWHDGYPLSKFMILDSVLSHGCLVFFELYLKSNKGVKGVNSSD